MLCDRKKKNRQHLSFDDRKSGRYDIEYFKLLQSALVSCTRDDVQSCHSTGHNYI